MTVKGEFEGLEYAFEEDGKEAADPFGRQFAGCGRWGHKERGTGGIHTVFPKKVRILTGKMTVFRLFLLRTASLQDPSQRFYKACFFWFESGKEGNL